MANPNAQKFAAMRQQVAGTLQNSFNRSTEEIRLSITRQIQQYARDFYKGMLGEGLAQESQFYSPLSARYQARKDRLTGSKTGRGFYEFSGGLKRSLLKRDPMADFGVPEVNYVSQFGNKTRSGYKAAGPNLFRDPKGRFASPGAALDLFAVLGVELFPKLVGKNKGAILGIYPNVKTRVTLAQRGRKATTYKYTRAGLRTRLEMMEYGHGGKPPPRPLLFEYMRRYRGVRLKSKIEAIMNRGF